MEGVGTLEQGCCSTQGGFGHFIISTKALSHGCSPPPAFWLLEPGPSLGTAPQGCPMCYFLPGVNCFGKCFAKRIPEGLLSILGCFDQSCLRSSFQRPG